MENTKFTQQKCTHRWHFYPDMSEIDTKNQTITETFICDKCGNMKEIKRGHMI